MALLDQFDVRILRQLQEDARLTNVKLASAVGLSPSPCLRRVRELVRRGIIRGQVALLDPDAVGLPVSTFIQVTLDKQAKEALEVFEAAVREQPEVMECYLMTGEADYLLRVVTPDLAAYHHFLMERLTRIPGIANIKSSLALKQVQYRTAMPLGHIAEGDQRRVTARASRPPVGPARRTGRSVLRRAPTAGQQSRQR
jgi:Lrp/AsnC family transcriptional regulator, leucine-responsive regulatory protein